MWYDHQFLRLRDTFAKNRQTCQKCASFLHFTNLEKKISKKALCTNVGEPVPDICTEPDFQLFPS